MSCVTMDQPVWSQMLNADADNVMITAMLSGVTGIIQHNAMAEICTMF